MIQSKLICLSLMESNFWRSSSHLIRLDQRIDTQTDCEDVDFLEVHELSISVAFLENLKRVMLNKILLHREFREMLYHSIKVHSIVLPQVDVESMTHELRNGFGPSD